jgi:phosphate:Na+ symporter
LLKRILLPVIFCFLAFGFWFSPEFKEIAAGIAIFLFGMLFLEQGFRAFTGGLLETLLRRTTDRFWQSLSFGIVTTTIMQSSSLVSVISISFLSAGLIGLTSGIGIIFGANLGTTTGAWLIAGFGLKVKISAYAMPMLAFGVVLAFQSGKTLKGVGHILAGLGFLFLGIHFMKQGFESFRDTIDLVSFAMEGVAGLAVFTLIGIGATVIMQSSHATLVLIITALAAGQVTYENALALAIGANVGTTVTAIIGAMSSNHLGKQLAGAHLIFNGLTSIIAIAVMGQLVVTVDWLAGVMGFADTDYTMKLAIFHTTFNAIGIAVMIPLVPRMVTLLQRIFPESTIDRATPRYLNDAAIDFPDTVFRAVQNETLHLYDNALEILAHGVNLHRHDILSDQPLDLAIARGRRVMDFDLDDVYERRVKELYAAIVDFISRAQAAIPGPFANRLFEARQACQLIVQAVKDVKHLRKNVNLYMISQNPHMRAEYNRMRKQLAEVLRTLTRIGATAEDERNILVLDEISLNAERTDIAQTGELDELIRTGAITPAMGTSLLNDRGYLQNAIRNLTEAGRALYGARSDELKEVEELLSLSDEEIAELKDNREHAVGERTS